MTRRLAVVSVCLCAAAGAGVRGVDAEPRVFVAQLSGSNESPPNGSTGTGFATVTIDAVAHTMQVDIAFQGLLAANTAAHIHATTASPFTGNAGVATTTPTFTGFPTGVTAGSYSHALDMTLASSYNPAFVTANGGVANAEAALFLAITVGRAYVNIHSSQFPGGEIRGFLVPAFTDDPLTAGVTVVKAEHITELRQRIDAQRVRFGLAAYAWTDPTLDAGAAVIKAQHVLDLRLALSQAYVAAGRTPPTYADPGLGAGTTIEVAHVAEVRAGVVALETSEAIVIAAIVGLNEVNANIASGCDLIELRVVSGGSMTGFRIQERTGGAAELNLTLPSFTVQTNDFIIIHMNSGSATCNPSSATQETTSPAEQPSVVWQGNFDTAYDFWSTDQGLTATDNVFTVFGASGTIIDALFASDDPAGPLTSSATETAAASVGAANQWSPALSAYPDTVFRMNAADDLNATGPAAFGTSLQRLDNTDGNNKADWTSGPGAVSTWGLVNAGQSQF